MDDELSFILGSSSFPVPFVAANKRFLVEPNIIVQLLQSGVYFASNLKVLRRIAQKYLHC